MKKIISQDFTMDMYREFCKAIVSSKYPALTFREYLSSETPKDFIILRHDVDRKPYNALLMAELEHECDVRSTYYFRTTKEAFQPMIMKKIEDMGHEIGYHYETLSKANGNFERAIYLFKQELNRFREYVKVDTICMHGSPLSKYDNRDLWKKYSYKQYGIIGEAYLSGKSVMNYFSDTGRSWNSKNNLRDHMGQKKANTNIIHSTADLISLIEKGDVSNEYITTHPERWAINDSEWVKGYIKDSILNFGKKNIILFRELFG
ncbi:MAG: hypothetical protein NC238_16010 [Dehalobacter sp.]|nr:hypothetical protein [Dehalobacter sp.]